MDYPRYGGRRQKLLFVPLVIVLFFVLSGAVQYLWNAVLPQTVHVGVITYWQSAGLLLLSRILFGNFNFGRRGGGPPGFIKQKWATMTEHERNKFREEFKERCRRREEY